MRDYLRIASKIRDSDWLITESGLALIVGIVNARMNGEKLTDEEIAARLADVGGYGNSEFESGGRVENGVGILPLHGPIFGKANMMTQLSGATSLEMFKKDFSSMLADHRVKSILLDVDSPGGTSDMVQTTGDLIYQARDIKPITAVANSNAGSAAYWLASQASEFYATPDGAVGSVGAYTVHEDQSVADANEGIKYTFISAGPYKTEGNPHEPLSQEGKNYRQEVIDELYNNFLSVVARGRNSTVEAVESNFGGGRMVPAKKALDAGMVDGIMEYDAVAESMTTKSASVAIPVQINGSVTQAVLDQETGVFKLESVGMEHSEPGTGSPPTPRPNESDRGAYGSRRGDLPEQFPNEKDAPGAPKASAIDNGGNMTEEQLKSLYALFNVDSEEALIAAVTNMHETSTLLESDVSLAAEEMSFKKAYPKLWQQMQDDRGKIRANDAQAFVDSVGRFAKLEGTELKASNMGLSALSSEKVSETYTLLADTPYLSAFVECMTTIANGGTLEYGEIGSGNEIDPPSVDLSADWQGIRAQFAAKIAEVQVRDGIDYKEAMLTAARENPELAKAYQGAKPVIR